MDIGWFDGEIGDKATVENTDNPMTNHLYCVYVLEHREYVIKQ